MTDLVRLRAELGLLRRRLYAMGAAVEPLTTAQIAHLGAWDLRCRVAETRLRVDALTSAHLRGWRPYPLRHVA